MWQCPGKTTNLLVEGIQPQFHIIPGVFRQNREPFLRLFQRLQLVEKDGADGQTPRRGVAAGRAEPEGRG